MAEVITMPRLSDTMTEGKVAKWHKKVGDKVKEGDILAEIETDKAVQDFESEMEGTLLYVGVEEGNAAAVDSVLAIIGKEGEDISGLTGGSTPSNDSSEKESTTEEKTADTEQTSSEAPEGVEVITMPRLSDTMTEGKVAKWHKNVGDTVKEGDLLAEIETDKAVQDFESEFNGVLLKQGVEEGGAAPVDSVLAIIGPEGTDVSGVGVPKPASQSSEKPAEQKAEAPKQTTDNQQSAASNNERVAISPLAKKMAQEKGLDISSVKGSGENGRIVKKDIENYQPSAKSADSVPSASPAAAQVALSLYRVKIQKLRILR